MSDIDSAKSVIIDKLDMLGYEIDLNDLDKDALLDIFNIFASDEEKEKAVKYNKVTLVSKCRKLGDDIDIDLLPESVLIKLLNNAQKEAGVSDKEQEETKVSDGSRIEESKRRLNNHEEPEFVNEVKIFEDNMGMTVRKTGKSKLKSVDCGNTEVLLKLQSDGVLVGYDPVTKKGFIRQ